MLAERTRFMLAPIRTKPGATSAEILLNRMIWNGDMTCTDWVNSKRQTVFSSHPYPLIHIQCHDYVLTEIALMHVCKNLASLLA